MKKINVKGNGMKKLVALLLVACIAIGLVSSTAIKLVSSAYYLQTKRQLVTPIPAVNKFINAVSGNTDNSGNGGSNAGSDVLPTPIPDNDDSSVPSETSPVDTTQAPQTTAESSVETTAENNAPATESKPTETTAVPTTKDETVATTENTSESESQTEAQTSQTEPQTDSLETVKLKKEILSKYKDIVNYAKKAGKPSFQKVTYRTLEKDIVSSSLLHGVESAYPEYFISKDNAEKVPVVVPANTKTTELCINNDYYACMLASADASAAIKTATDVKLKDGTSKITIVLRDETDPTPTEAAAKKAASYTSAMFPVIAADTVKEKVQSTLFLEKISSVELTYTDCTVELIYNPKLNRIISMTQTVKYNGEIKGTVLSANGTVTEISEYSDFNYGLL